MFDYCMVFKNEEKFFRAHFDSLFQHENIDFPLHVTKVGGGLLPDIEYAKDMKLYWIPEYKKKMVNGSELNSPASYEASYAYDWMMRNCGEEEWTILVHPDTRYAKSLLNEIKEKMEIPDIGIIGYMGFGLFAVRKKAYEESDIGFASLMGVLAAPHPGSSNTLCLRSSMSDPRPIGSGKIFSIEGLDSTELLITDLCNRGWKYEIMDRIISSKLPHLGSGALRGGNESWPN